LFNHLNKEFAKPVRHTDETHEYLPTQFFAEWAKDHGYDGLRYESAMSQGGQNVVFFDTAAVAIKSVRPGPQSYVQLRSGLVQDQNRRILENGAGNGGALPLAAAQSGAPLTDHGVVPVRQLVFLFPTFVSIRQNVTEQAMSTSRISSVAGNRSSMCIRDFSAASHVAL
jgi:RES domain-containing protein